MSFPDTVHSKEFHEAFTRGDYPALVQIADNFAQTLALDAAHDTKLTSNTAVNFLTQQQDEYDRNHQ